MKQSSKGIRGCISSLMLGAAIGIPTGIITAQPIDYIHVRNRLERLTEENPRLAQNFADRLLVNPNRSLFEEIGLYGAKKAARDYLRKN